MQHNINHHFMRLPGIIILFLCFADIFDQNETFDKVKQMIDMKKYESATKKIK
jgi:hypothetical protein